MYFSVWGIVILLIIGLLAGAIANAVMKRQSKSLLMDTLLGVAGAFVGSWLFQLIGFYSAGDFLPSLITATIGAIVLLWLGRLLSNSRVRY